MQQSLNVVAQQMTDRWVGGPSLLSDTHQDALMLPLQTGSQNFRFWAPFESKFSTVYIQSDYPRWILTPAVNSVCLPLCLSSVMLCMWFTFSAVTLLTVQCLCIQTIAFTHLQPQTQCHTPVHLPVCVRRVWESQMQGLQGLRRTPDTLVCGITESQTESISFLFFIFLFL